MAIDVINGSDLYVFMNAAVIAHATSHTLSMKMNTRDTSNKDTGKFNTKAVGRMDVTATTDALVVYVDFAAMMQAYLDREPVHLAFGERSGATLVDGEYSGGTLDTTKFYADGNFIITSLDMNAADQENASYSATFENADANFTYTGEGTLRAYIVSQNCTAIAADDGIAVVMPAGGTAPYAFSWDTTTPSITQAIEDLAPGTYTVTVTDDALASVTVSCVITEPAV